MLLKTNQNLSYKKLHIANVPISKYLTPYAEKFDSLLNLHASSRLLLSFMI